jgi:hypothetical protein
MGAAAWALSERVVGIAGGVFALVVAVAVIAYAGLGACSVWRHARPGRVLPAVIAEDINI